MVQQVTKYSREVIHHGIETHNGGSFTQVKLKLKYWSGFIPWYWTCSVYEYYV